MLDEIKKLAGSVSEAYLTKKAPMTDAIVIIAKSNKLNEELIKRLCEIANQNTYLSLFHGSKDGRGNIEFDLADAAKVIEKIKELDMGNEDYLKTPRDYRLGDEEDEEDEDTIVAEPDDDKSLVERVNDLNKKTRMNDRLTVLLSAIKSMKAQEELDAERNVLKLSSYCKNTITTEQSFADMSKLALRYSKDRGFGVEKTAGILSYIQEDLESSGHKLNKELTKLSSMPINPGAEMFRPIEGYNMNLVKLAGLDQLEKGVGFFVELMKHVR